jgi:pimeloyl-ACP methyl ester carboxylesterase
MTKPPAVPVSRFFSAQDGLKLHLRDYDPGVDAMPVVCLPGLSRTADDFDVLATRLSQTRRVVAIDYRGRGLSERDPDWTHYDISVEGADILTQLAAIGIHRAIVVGTSRGGLISMLLAATRPTLLHAVVLNDIGPVIEAKGLARIRGYIGKLPPPKSWADAVDLAKGIMSAHFTGLDEAAWDAYARLTFEEKDGRFLPRYDPALAKPLEALDFEKPIPQLWPQFEGLRDIPVLTLRGENSDLLSPETLAEMARRHPRFESHIVPGQGHAPLLLDDPTISRIEQVVTAAAGADRHALTKSAA